MLAGNDKAFAAGADIGEMATASAMDMLYARRVERWDAIRKLWTPLVAAVSGYCLGGGNELAMSCDLIVASETAKFGQPETSLGIIPGAGGTQRLTRAIGKAKAMDVILSGRFLTAEEAERAGLVARVVGPDAWLDEAKSVAREIASKGPVAQRLAKEAVNRAFDTTLDHGLEHERRLLYLAFASEDAARGPDRLRREAPARVQGQVAGHSPAARFAPGSGRDLSRAAMSLLRAYSPNGGPRVPTRTLSRPGARVCAGFECTTSAPAYDARMSDVLTERDGGVLTITLNRPDKLNAFTGAMHAELAKALEEAADPDVRAVVITGAGRGFCVGQDLSEFEGGTGDIAHRLRTTYNPNVLALRALEKPVIAAVNGPAAGAGLSFACACDIRIAADTASFVPAFSAIGLVPDTGGSYFVTQLLGYARAFEWMTTSRKLPADEALDWGLVSEVVPADELVARAARARRGLRGDADQGDRDDQAPARRRRDDEARGAARTGSRAPGRRHADRGLRRGRRRLPREARPELQGPLATRRSRRSR